MRNKSFFTPKPFCPDFGDFDPVWGADAFASNLTQKNSSEVGFGGILKTGQKVGPDSGSKLSTSPLQEKTLLPDLLVEPFRKMPETYFWALFFRRLLSCGWRRIRDVSVRRSSTRDPAVIYPFFSSVPLPHTLSG